MAKEFDCHQVETDSGTEIDGAGLDELAAGALILYPLYRSPETGRLCAAEEAVEGLAGGRNMLSLSVMERTLRLLQTLPFWARFWAR